MKQLTYVKTRKLVWWEVPEPRLQGPAEALVRPFVAARCDGDSFFLRHDLEGLLRLGATLHIVDPAFRHARDDVFHGPFAYGHECVAEVVAVGDDVRGFAPGDTVIVPWTVSCGTCTHCGRGLTAHCERSASPLAAYGFAGPIGGYGGMVSDVVRVPFADAMLVHVPKGLDPIAVASASDNMPDGYRAVAPHLQQRPGAPVLVLGGAAKSIGLYAAGFAVALGSSQVDYVDTDLERLRVAEALGANPIQRKRHELWFGRRQRLRSDGYPIAVDGTGTGAGLRYALEALAPGGICTALAFYVMKGTPLPLWKMYMKSATLHVGVAHPLTHLPALLQLIERGDFDPMRISPLVGDWSDAPSILLEPAIKVVVQRPRTASSYI